MSDAFDATNAQVMEIPRGRPVREQEDIRPDIGGIIPKITGSSLFIVFTPRFNAVVAAFSKEDLLYKLPCGKVEHRDIPGPESVEFKDLITKLYGGDTLPYAELVKAVAGGKRLDYRTTTENDASPEYAAFLSALARRGALRELKSETDIGEGELVYVGQLAYTRPIYKRDKFLRQFHFFGILERQNQLSRNCTESSEMGDPEYWDPVEILRWDVPFERKLNPYHRIAFARCLIEMRDQGVAKEVSDFAALLKRIADAGFDIDEYETSIKVFMKNRDPRT